MIYNYKKLLKNKNFQKFFLKGGDSVKCKTFEICVKFKESDFINNSLYVKGNYTYTEILWINHITA